MLARIRKAMEKKDDGFTLIELLVVMIIIGILAAIAIPVFLSQKQKAYESSLKADLTTIATDISTVQVDDPASITFTGTTGSVSIQGFDSSTPPVAQGSAEVAPLSPNNSVIKIGWASQDKYCVQLENSNNVGKDWIVYAAAAGQKLVNSGSCDNAGVYTP